MYEELVKSLRLCTSDKRGYGCAKECAYGKKHPLNWWCMDYLLKEAADAIEELSRELDGVCSDNDALCKRIDELSKPQWIPFKTRPMDAEERQYYKEHHGYDLSDDEAVIYVSQLPDHGQEVLVCNERGSVWIDTFDDDPDYGIGFEEHGDMDGVEAWMPRPKPYEPPKEET